MYIFDNCPLPNIFCKYFLPACGLSSHSLDRVFWRAEVFNFNEVQLINYFFHGLVLSLKCYHQIPSHLDFPLVLHLHLGLWHIWADFLKGVRSVSRFIFLHVDVQLVVPAPSFCWKTIFVPLWLVPLLLFQRSVDYICEGLFLSSLFCFIHLSVLLPIPHCLDHEVSFNSVAYVYIGYFPSLCFLQDCIKGLPWWSSG